MRVIDGNNYFRRMLEADPSGLVIRNLYNETQASPRTVFWVWDGNGGVKRRKDIYPAYKDGRQRAAESVYASMKLLKQVLCMSKAISIEVPGYEADDVIAAIAKTAKPPIEIESNDSDFLQLTTLPGVTTTRHKGPAAPHLIRLFKTLVGDASDSVKGVPGFGEKTWERANHEVLLAYVAFGRGGLHNAQLPPKPRAWMEAHPAELKILWQIVGFFDVPQADLQKSIKVGVPNQPAVEEILGRFFL